MECTTKIKCEPLTKRLSKTNYNRPELTLTDTLQSNEEMQKKLLKYTRVDDIEDVRINTHVRYVTLKNSQQRFCLGGLLKKIHNKYVILSNGTLSWSVQRYHWDDPSAEPIFETTFFRLLSVEEQQKKIILEQQREIEKLKKK
jgi:hypothetical protein